MARLCALALALLFAPSFAFGQTLGTFRWQLAPFCNIVTLAVTQNAGVFEVEGTDDQCGAVGTQASAIGTAFINPDGSVGIGVNIISTPGGLPVHVDATTTVATLGGTWRDSAGNSGSFVFTPAAGTGGNPRPAPATGIAPGTVGSAHINPAQVQRRVTGSCSIGTFVTSLGEDGSVACGVEAGDITEVRGGGGLTGGGSSGNVTLSLARTPTGAFSFDNTIGFVSVGPGFLASIPIEGPGTRLMWYAAKAAFRAGGIIGDHGTTPTLESIALRLA